MLKAKLRIFTGAALAASGIAAALTACGSNHVNLQEIDGALAGQQNGCERTITPSFQARRLVKSESKGGENSRGANWVKASQAG